MSRDTFPFLFSADIQRAYKAGFFTDLKITCGSNQFMVHKIIVCSQSKVFHATCSNGFMESSTNTIDLTADGISLVSRVIHCLYHGAYADFDAIVDAQYWKSGHQLHAAMYALGDKYDLTILKETALVNFDKFDTGSVPNNILGLIQSIPIVYSSTPDSDRDLRNATLDKIVTASSALLDNDVKASFRKVLFEVPDFSWDLHQYWLRLIHLAEDDSAKEMR